MLSVIGLNVPTLTCQENLSLHKMIELLPPNYFFFSLMTGNSDYMS